MLSANFKSPAALFRFVGVCAIGLTLDLSTKVFAVRYLANGESYEAIPGWLNFTYTGNHGAVFGLGVGLRWLFVAVSVLAIGFLTWLFAQSRGQRFYQILLGLLLAGVLGNMYDRITLGYVRDMILALPGWHWPGTWHLGPYPAAERGVFPYIFNVADTLLCTGVFLMIVYSALNPMKHDENLKDEIRIPSQ